MLQNVLEQIRNSDGTVSLEELSRKLGIEPSALEGMLEYCVRKGILQESLSFPVGDGCGNTMSSCGSICEGYHGCPLIVRMPRTYELRKSEPRD